MNHYDPICVEDGAGYTISDCTDYQRGGWDNVGIVNNAFDGVPYLGVEKYMAGRGGQYDSMISAVMYRLDENCYSNAAGTASHQLTLGHSAILTMYSDATCTNVESTTTIRMEHVGVSRFGLSYDDMTFFIGVMDHSAALFGANSPHLVVEEYPDQWCLQVENVTVYSADGSCHTSSDGATSFRASINTADSTATITMYSDSACNFVASDTKLDGQALSSSPCLSYQWYTISDCTDYQRGGWDDVGIIRDAFDGVPYLGVEKYMAGRGGQYDSMISAVMYRLDENCYSNAAGTASHQLTLGHSAILTMYSDATCTNVESTTTIRMEHVGVSRFGLSYDDMTFFIGVMDHSAALFGANSPHLVVEEYPDQWCLQVENVTVYSADGSCHTSSDGATSFRASINTADSTATITMYSDSACNFVASDTKLDGQALSSSPCLSYQCEHRFNCARRYSVGGLGDLSSPGKKSAVVVYEDSYCAMSPIQVTITTPMQCMPPPTPRCETLFAGPNAVYERRECVENVDKFVNSNFRSTAYLIVENYASGTSCQILNNATIAPPSECDECEQRTAQVNCDDCGLVYCSQCDVHRHRKGKLQLHKRVQITRNRFEAPELEEILEEAGNSTANWKNYDVCEWLEAHDLKLFVEEAQVQKITGATLLSSEGLEKFLDAATGVSRGHKKKLQREVQKLQNLVKTEASESKMSPTPAPSPPIRRASNSMRRIGLDLRVDVEPAAAKPPPRRGTSLKPLGLGQLKIEVNEDDRAAIAAPTRTAGGRKNSGSLGLDIAQVKKEEKTVAASFDFSATGRLQTQGFEIDTRGIANAPFANSQQHSGNGTKPVSSTESISTKDHLLILEELGHGAGGKVYKALYMPTFRLVAVKVIRVYDQKKRHQMVRELKSLYVNFVPLATATFPSTSAATSSATQAACEELVVFYDAYTNPEIGSVSIVLEYMDGGSLEDYVQSASEGGGCLTEKEIANVAACGLKGLAFLHEHHQLHRDIKLSNMLINHQGQVKISDFGISRDLESTLAKATTFTGTLLYMAPERISGGMYSYPSDLWSFGLAVMACAIGKLPVPTKDGYWGVVHAVQEQPSPRLRDYGDHFSPELCDFLDQCLQKNPMYRPPAAGLLEHPFIKKNYSPREQTNVRLSRDQQPPTAKALEHSRQELRNIAEKAQICGALTPRSITFKFGLREGYTCVDSDFVLYAFPELLEGEKPHSSIATCSDVDGGETGDGEARSPASYDTPNVKGCTLSNLPHSDRRYRYELTLLKTGETVFEEIKKENALFFMHTGDLHYHNLVVNNVAAFRDGYDSIFASPAGQSMLAMDVPFVYMWDDHDFGPDNSDSTAPGRNASVQATPNTAPAAATKTVLGKKQKAWFKTELVRVTSDPNIRLIIWVNTMPWLDDERKWGHFVHEQQELVNFIKAHGLNKWVPIVIVSGDAHMLAVDDGSHSPGNLTVLHSAALGRPGSIKGGPYSHGAFPGSGQYAVMDVTDEGGKDGRVCLYYRGMNIYKGKLVEFDTCHPERTPPVTPYYPPPIPVRIMMRVFKKAKRYTGTAAFVVITVIALVVCRSRRQRAVDTKKHS
ncbi:hypothetical protein JG688_00004685 [Phytophthora aleatoria]|uniref:Serine/threonine protein kinase n=1 Tax=Phytophthora aleatoria TaxID=2496075 RepID=A0A8J5JA86_9STRA|nr:hypothetical protein JG688_00004685 [Phytophthora aleatoria]